MVYELFKRVDDLPEQKRKLLVDDINNNVVVKLSVRSVIGKINFKNNIILNDDNVEYYFCKHCREYINNDYLVKHFIQNHINGLFDFEGISERYIDMCINNHAIQYRWNNNKRKPQKGDRFLNENYDVKIIGDSCFDGSCFMTHALFIDSQNRQLKNPLWLPRIEDILLLDNEINDNIEDVLIFFNDGSNKYYHRHYLSNFDTLEEIFLAKFMYKNYNKIWIDENKQWSVVLTKKGDE